MHKIGLQKKSYDSDILSGIAVIREDPDAFPTCVEYSSDNYLIIGDVAGGVHLG